jgi:hypothetical protein
MGPMGLYDFNGYPGVMDCKSRNHDAAGIIVISSSSSSFIIIIIHHSSFIIIIIIISISITMTHFICYAATRATISYQSVISAAVSSSRTARRRSLELRSQQFRCPAKDAEAA